MKGVPIRMHRTWRESPKPDYGLTGYVLVVRYCVGAAPCIIYQNLAPTYIPMRGCVRFTYPACEGRSIPSLTVVECCRCVVPTASPVRADW